MRYEKLSLCGSVHIEEQFNYVYGSWHLCAHACGTRETKRGCPLSQCVHKMIESCCVISIWQFVMHASVSSPRDHPSLHERKCQNTKQTVICRLCSRNRQTTRKWVIRARIPDNTGCCSLGERTPIIIRVWRRRYALLVGYCMEGYCRNVGICINTVFVVVLSRRHMRHCVTNVLLMGVAVNDLVVRTSMIVYFMVIQYIQSVRYVYCRWTTARCTTTRTNGCHSCVSTRMLQ